jgi:hypothetical protein
MMKDLLFDDILFGARAREEHRRFQQILRFVVEESPRSRPVEEVLQTGAEERGPRLSRRRRASAGCGPLLNGLWTGWLRASSKVSSTRPRHFRDSRPLTFRRPSRTSSFSATRRSSSPTRSSGSWRRLRAFGSPSRGCSRLPSPLRREGDVSGFASLRRIRPPGFTRARMRLTLEGGDVPVREDVLVIGYRKGPRRRRRGWPSR